MPPPAAGMLLVATPELADPTFAATVVLLIEVEAGGALGVVLNRPSPVPVDEVLGDWAGLVAEPELLFQGGPVGADGALALALLHAPGGAEGADRSVCEDPVGFREVVGGLGLVDLDTPVELLVDVVARLRIFAGYAGWGAAQLEAEIAEGSWYVVPGEPGDAFHGETDGLRREVLRRQPGELAWYSTRPADPLLN